jgi:hypothetical protein
MPRFWLETESGRLDSYWLLLFNDVIDSLDLGEVLFGRKFTWVNSLLATYEKLHRVIMDISKEL